MNFSTLGLSLCGEEAPWFLGLFDFSTAHPLLYYSYVPIAAISVIVGLFIFFNNKKSLQNKLILVVNLFFALWVLNVLVQWVASYHIVLMFAWQLTALLEVGMFLSTAYFAYVFLYKKDLPATGKWVLGLLALGVIALTPTTLNVGAYDLYNCEGINGLLWDIIYALEPAIIIAMAYMGIVAYRKETDKDFKKQIILLTSGLVVFLTTFFISNFHGEVTKVYEFNLWGPIGMFIFLLLLAYMVVEFKAFNAKTFGTQVLVAFLWALVASLLFLTDLATMRGIVAATLVVLLPVGISLVRSVRKEIELRGQLEIANKRQQETLRFITHEVKGYLTDGAAALDAIKTEVFGPVNAETKAMVGEALTKNRNAVREIQNFLRIADFKTGKVAYAVTPFDLKTELDKLLVTASETTSAKGLIFKQDIAPGDYSMKGDSDQLINHVIGNLVNNAINYTPSGDVTVHAERKPGSILVSVKDSGVGLTDEDKAVLFTEGGHGKESRTVNPHSTGYGLYIAKQIVDAHKGRIWAESEGRGKGSTFLVELPTSGSGK